MSWFCHKNVMSVYLFSGLFLFTTFCKHCGELSPSSSQVGTHPMWVVTLVLCSRVVRSATSAISNLTQYSWSHVDFDRWLKVPCRFYALPCKVAVQWGCRAAAFLLDHVRGEALDAITRLPKDEHGLREHRKKGGKSLILGDILRFEN